jgi:hypothetical protein
MVALAQSDSAAPEDGRRGDNCDGDYPHNRWCYLGRTPRPHILNGFALRPLRNAFDVALNVALTRLEIIISLILLYF